MQKPLIVVPLDGTSPFLIHDSDLFAHNELVKHYAESEEHWLIDPSDNTFLMKSEDEKKVLTWYEIEEEDQSIKTANVAEQMVAS